MDVYIGQLICAGFGFAPVGWAACDGQLLPIAQNSALFSLLGTTYGGDGITTFALPDLRGRSAIHQGHGPDLQPRRLGEHGRHGENRADRGPDSAAFLTMNWLIATEGIYPSRP